MDKDDFEDFAAGLSDKVVFIAATVTLVATGNSALAVTVQVVGGLAVATVGDDFGVQQNGEDNGLLLMSAGNATHRLIGEFPHDVCAGEDCLEDKGFNYARVQPVGSPSTDGTAFVDLFCTHLQNASPELADRVAGEAARNEQLRILKTSIDDLAAPDRRPILIGDLNFDANTEDVYRTLRETLELTALAAFEERNGFLSDRYDLGVRDGATTRNIDIDRFFDPNLFDSPHFTGVGTSLGRGRPCHEMDPEEGNRLDYIFVLPSVQERPNFGVVEESFEIFPFFPGASMNVDDSNHPERAPADGDSLGGEVMLPPYEGVATHTGSCLSDHAAVVANIGLVRLRHDTVLNPFRDYRFEFRVANIETNDGDCFGCGDPDMLGSLLHSTDDTTVVEPFGPVDDSKVISDAASAAWCQPALASNQSPAVQAFQLELNESDSTSPDDHFDVSPINGEDNAFYRFVEGDQLFLSDSTSALLDSRCDFLRGGNVCRWPRAGDSDDSEKATVTYVLSYEDVGSACSSP